MKQIESIIKEMNIKGIFVKEIKENYTLLLKALIEIGLEVEEYGATFGIYFAKLKFKEESRVKELLNLLEESNLKYDLKYKKTLIVYTNKEVKTKKVNVFEKRNITFTNNYESFEAIEKILNGLKRDYKKVKDITFGTKYISFMEEIERDETEKETLDRIEKENNEYISLYKEMSKKYEDFKKMKKIFEGYEE